MKLTTEQLKKMIKEELESILNEVEQTDAELEAQGKIENALKQMGVSPLDLSNVPGARDKAGSTINGTLVKVKGEPMAVAYKDGTIRAYNKKLQRALATAGGE